MASFLTSDELIESVVRRTHIPKSQITFTDQDILAFANEEMMIGMLPSIMKLHEEFYVYPFEIPLLPSQNQYEIPDRSIGDKVRTMFYKDNSQTLQEMARILPEDLAFYQARFASVYPRAFYLENNFVVLVPEITQSPQGSIVMKTFLRPNQLVPNKEAGIIQSIDTINNIITVSTVPTGFKVNLLYDFIQMNRSHRTKGMDIPVLAINPLLKTITFAPGTIPDSLIVGDYMNIAQQTIVPQMPDELHSVLAQRVACRALEAQKDSEGLQNAMAKLAEMETNTGMLIDNRTPGAPSKINNLRGTLRAGKFRRFRTGY
jgi:hypothetical protein